MERGGTKRVEVVCCFMEDGSLIPVRFKVSDEYQERHSFKVLQYKLPQQSNKEKKTDNVIPRSVPYILDYECVIQTALNIRKIVTLRYIANKMEWYVIY